MRRAGPISVPTLTLLLLNTFNSEFCCISTMDLCPSVRLADMDLKLQYLWQLPEGIKAYPQPLVLPVRSETPVPAVMPLPPGPKGFKRSHSDFRSLITRLPNRPIMSEKLLRGIQTQPQLTLLLNHHFMFLHITISLGKLDMQNQINLSNNPKCS